MIRTKIALDVNSRFATPIDDFVPEMRDILLVSTRERSRYRRGDRGSTTAKPSIVAAPRPLRKDMAQLHDAERLVQFQSCTGYLLGIELQEPRTEGLAVRYGAALWYVTVVCVSEVFVDTTHHDH
jgi:hypothetical protein